MAFSLQSCFVSLSEEKESPKKRRKKKNQSAEEELEPEYEQIPKKRPTEVKPLLPIKTKAGLIPQSTTIDRTQGNYQSTLPALNLRHAKRLYIYT